jgi:tryptophan-rich sensory protein
MACGAAAATGSLFPPGEWYRGLTKPAWTPPNWLFPVAWTALYLMIALAAARLSVLPGNAYAMALWAVQIALNTLWTPTFFGAHRTRLALVVIVALWLVVLALIVVAFALDPLAGLMLLPYELWLSYAAALNFWIDRHNPGARDTAA